MIVKISGRNLKNFPPLSAKFYGYKKKVWLKKSPKRIDKTYVPVIFE